MRERFSPHKLQIRDKMEYKIKDELIVSDVEIVDIAKTFANFCSNA